MVLLKYKNGERATLSRLACTRQQHFRSNTNTERALKGCPVACRHREAEKANSRKPGFRYTGY